MDISQENNLTRQIYFPGAHYDQEQSAPNVPETTQDYATWLLGLRGNSLWLNKGDGAGFDAIYIMPCIKKHLGVGAILYLKFLFLQSSLGIRNKGMKIEWKKYIFSQTFKQLCESNTLKYMIQAQKTQNRNYYNSNHIYIMLTVYSCKHIKSFSYNVNKMCVSIFMLKKLICITPYKNVELHLMIIFCHLFLITWSVSWSVQCHN